MDHAASKAHPPKVKGAELHESIGQQRDLLNPIKEVIRQYYIFQFPLVGIQNEALFLQLLLHQLLLPIK